jgi:hypothetical protein
VICRAGASPITRVCGPVLRPPAPAFPPPPGRFRRGPINSAAGCQIARLSGLSRSPRIVTTVHWLPPAVDGADVSHWSRRYFKKWLKCIALFQLPVSVSSNTRQRPAPPRLPLRPADALS